MKIIKAPNKKVGDKVYHKYIISAVPPEIVKESGLLGKDLKASVEKGKIILEKE